MKNKYTAEYFIKKFTAIPARRWTTGVFVDSQGRSCAFGHCGRRVGQVQRPLEARKLEELFWPSRFSVIPTNDGSTFSIPQKTPKGRILAALRIIRKSLSK